MGGALLVLVALAYAALWFWALFGPDPRDRR